MASPVPDGLATVNNWVTTTTKTVTLTTSLANDSICVAVSISNASNIVVAPAVLSMTSPSGLVFTRCFRTTGPQVPAGGGIAGELWTAPSAAALTGEVITITLNASPDACCIAAFGVHGPFSIAAPFDSNASLPVTGGSTTLPPPTLAYSTTQANDLILYMHAHINPNPGLAPTGWTLITSLLNSNPTGAQYSSMIVASLGVSAAQTGATVTAPGGTTATYAAGLTAFTADAAPAPPSSPNCFSRARQLSYLRR